MGPQAGGICQAPLMASLSRGCGWQRRPAMRGSGQTHPQGSGLPEVLPHTWELMLCFRLPVFAYSFPRSFLQ